MIIKTPEEMFELGKELSKKCKIILIKGRPSSGKSKLVEGFAGGLGIEDELTRKPIEVLGNKLLHVDMLSVVATATKGLREKLKTYEYIAIEHSDILGDVEGTKIIITHGRGGERIVTIENE